MAEGSGNLSRGYDGLPLPFGWFAVAYSDEIPAGEVRTLRYFGTEFVVWRGEDGRLGAVDPYCPHLGAHLGHGGVVIENDLQCPFHHWSWNRQGGVTDIPYTKVIPPKLKRPECLSTWTVAESLGVIYTWYHPKKAGPKWELATRPEVTELGWVEAERHEWLFDIHIQEITENGQDYAHFGPIHGTQGPPASEFKIEGWVRRNSVETKMVTPRGPVDGKIEMEAVGPGQSFIRYYGISDVLHAQQVTAISPKKCHVRWQLYHPADISEGKMRVTKAQMRDLVKQTTQDGWIWDYKRNTPEPLLVEGDGPILAYRQQYARFYDFDEPTAVAAE